MKKNIPTLNEEIERIKSLFTEERMFGNLVREAEGDETTEDDGEKKSDDPFSKKTARKSKKAQKKGDKDISNISKKGDKQVKKDKKQYNRKLNKFCKKEVGKLVTIFIDKKNRLSSPFKPGGMTWDELLRSHKLNYSKSDETTEKVGYNTVVKRCWETFGSDELDIKSYAGKSPNDILTILAGITDDSKDLKNKEKLLISFSGDKKQKKKTSLGSVIFDTDDGYNAGELFLNKDVNGYVYTIKKNNKFTPVQKDSGGKFKIRDGYKTGIVNAIKELNKKVKEENSALTDIKDINSVDNISFIDDKKFRIK